MRGIKFRQWWRTPFNTYRMTYDPVIGYNPFDLNKAIKYSEENDMVLMQFTGLKDINGTEIYEGDILTTEFYPFQDYGKHNYHGVVEWIDETASFYITKRIANNEKRGISDGISEPIEDISEFEIIGNIYENPELLKSNANET